MAKYVRPSPSSLPGDFHNAEVVEVVDPPLGAEPVDQCPTPDNCSHWPPCEPHAS